MGKLFGPGASDAKGALAVTLTAAAVGGYHRDVAFVFHAGRHDWRTCDDTLREAELVLLAEPTDSVVRGGGLDHPAARQLIGLTGADPVSDAGGAHGLAHCASLGVPAVAFGPGEKSVAGTPEELVPTAQLTRCEFVLRQWLTAQP